MYDITQASYKVAWRVARCEVCLAEELIIPAALDMLQCIGSDDIVKKIESIPLSNTTIARLIMELSNDILDQLIEEIKIALQFDESTDISDLSQLMVFSRFKLDTEIV